MFDDVDAGHGRREGERGVLICNNIFSCSAKREKEDPCTRLTDTHTCFVGGGRCVVACIFVAADCRLQRIEMVSAKTLM